MSTNDTIKSASVTIARDIVNAMVPGEDADTCEIIIDEYLSTTNAATLLPKSGRRNGFISYGGSKKNGLSIPLICFMVVDTIRDYYNENKSLDISNIEKRSYDTAIKFGISREEAIKFSKSIACSVSTQIR